MRSVSPADYWREHTEGSELVDVRTPAEFEAVHAEGARLVPLDRLEPAEFTGAGRRIYLICKSGQRAGVAWRKLTDAGAVDVLTIDGGTTAWEAAGFPVVRGTRRVISLERQVRIGAGLLVLIGLASGAIVHPYGYGLAAFIGAGLIFAGVTDFCGMAMILARMPWNRASGTNDGTCGRRVD